MNPKTKYAAVFSLLVAIFISSAFAGKMVQKVVLEDGVLKAKRTLLPEGPESISDPLDPRAERAELQAQYRSEFSSLKDQLKAAPPKDRQAIRRAWLKERQSMLQRVNEISAQLASNPQAQQTPPEANLQPDQSIQGKSRAELIKMGVDPKSITEEQQ